MAAAVAPDAINPVTDAAGEEAQELFAEFLEKFTDALSEDPDAKLYLVRIKDMVHDQRNTLMVDFRHLLEYDVTLAEAVEQTYFRFEPFLRKGIQKVVSKHHPEYASISDRERAQGGREFFISIYGLAALLKLRDLRTSRIATLCSFSGTVTRTSEVRPELLYGHFTCSDCKAPSALIEQQFKFTEPTKCRNPACTNQRQWELDISESKFADWQRVRVQENSSEIPAGSMPRSLDVILRNETVEKAKAGDRCVFTGTLIVVPDVSQLNTPGAKAHAVSAHERSGRGFVAGDGVSGLKALGSVRDLTYKLAFLANHVRAIDSADESMGDKELTEEEVAAQFTPEQREEIARMAETPDLYRKMVQSITPAVYGHEEVKRGVLLMLFGGVHKRTPEGMALRGDINVCIVGDPSTAKSQFLKYIVGFYRRAIYTSGKASSAAGLTATVVKDADSGEFAIEAGALMLADNGICCIDEFDKMDPKDQVAIHEAMEQQTISISKAGINATLNARTAILAAANPIGGRYDRAKTLKANLNIGAAIMSRFDLFFMVLDEQDEQADVAIARHIISVHRNQERALTPHFSTEQLQRYITFARAYKPSIPPETAKVFAAHYRKLRESDIGGGKTSYRMTVRQLESMIRLSEALARLHLDRVVREKYAAIQYVHEAARLLRKSVIHVEGPDVQLEEAPRITAPVGGVDEDSGAKKADEEKKRKQAPRKKRVLSYEQYQKMANMLVLLLRRSKNEGLTQIALMHAYLADREADGEIQNEEALINETNLTRSVIERLLTKDHILIVAQDAPDLDQRVLTANPNYDPSGQISDFRKTSS